ncbi:MAG: hypothetical protein ACI9S8_002392 [Chlamydiales bacterium]|jgi:hypothetical protein
MNRLHQLMMNEEGFIFDPTTGETFTVNITGMMILKGLKEGKTSEDVASELVEKFEVSVEDAERDIGDFVNHLRIHKIMQ